MVPSSAYSYPSSNIEAEMEMYRKHTSQSVNRPLFELLQRNLRRWRCIIEVQSVRIIHLLKDRVCKLSTFMIKIRSSFGIELTKILSNHIEVDLSLSLS